MEAHPLNAWLQNGEAGWQAWHPMFRQFFFAGIPAHGDWKGRLQTGLEQRQRLDEWQQSESSQWRQAWRQHVDADGWLDYCQQCQDISQQFGHQLLNWQLKLITLWREQSYELLRNLLDSRGGADDLLAVNALHQRARQNMGVHQEDLQQLLTGFSPALLDSLRQFLAPKSESPTN
ncbi:hypothetical protein [Pseudogulbenkiania ferrooxidans]|uniref:Uncharacterized protein n=1 Tax=Pseudogulbenkiania ferrooxidans EGD-HP2 TaxID=1388764 RepID=A0ABN0N7T5_9NEIS|nr:hypothetical protein [Pseudogulbenkiania ferrooxidans]ERE07122.1 hypothetical protein O166_01225 [Pseudogulbenkiania ferrooxidans EGD-HP2]